MILTKASFIQARGTAAFTASKPLLLNMHSVEYIVEKEVEIGGKPYQYELVTHTCNGYACTKESLDAWAKQAEDHRKRLSPS